MSKIEIQYKRVKSIGREFSPISKKVSQTATCVSNIHSQLNPKIKSRRNISSDLSSIAASLSEVSQKINRIEKVIDKSAELYEQAEKKIEREAKKIDIDKTFKGIDPVIKLTSYGVKIIKGIMIIDYPNGLKLNISYKNRQFLINLRNEITDGNSHSYNNVRNMFEEYFGRVGKVFRRGDLEELFKNGMPLYTIGNIFTGEKFLKEHYKTSHIFDRVKDNNPKSFKDLLNKSWSTTKKVAKNSIKNLPKSILNEAYDTLNVFSGWKGVLNIERLGKSMGILGLFVDGVSAWNKANEKDKTCWKTFWVEFGVDTALGIGGGAVGAAVGSAIIPPLGTFIGLGIGIGIDVMKEVDLFENGSKSIGDVVKAGTMKVVNKVESGIKTIKKGASKLADSISESLQSKKGSFAW